MPGNCICPRRTVRVPFVQCQLQEQRQSGSARQASSDCAGVCLGAYAEIYPGRSGANPLVEDCPNATLHLGSTTSHKSRAAVAADDARRQELLVEVQQNINRHRHVIVIGNVGLPGSLESPKPEIMCNSRLFKMKVDNGLRQNVTKDEQ